MPSIHKLHIRVARFSAATGLVGAPACGDVMQLQFRVDDDGKFMTAAASLVTLPLLVRVCKRNYRWQTARTDNMTQKTAAPSPQLRQHSLQVAGRLDLMC